MAKGGKRPGAGRKAGAATRRTREIAERVASSGEISPLEVLLVSMRAYHDAAEDARRAYEAAEPDQKPAAFIALMELRKETGRLAASVAPYLHPRMSPAEDKPKATDGFVPLVERLKHYEQREAISASAGKVVALKKRGK